MKNYKYFDGYYTKNHRASRTQRVVERLYPWWLAFKEAVAIYAFLVCFVVITIAVLIN